jgi:hypothetical protein
MSNIGMQYLAAKGKAHSVFLVRRSLAGGYRRIRMASLGNEKFYGLNETVRLKTVS